MIFLVILLTILIIWLLYPQSLKVDENQPLHTKIFNLVKIPTIAICFIIIIFSLLSSDKPDNLKNLDVYMAIPKY